jgi:NAD(P)-dependent dehydrogenase (short-subunit alcohol dehydrogenase family)
MVLDLADRASIAAFTAAWSGPLHVLINNARIVKAPQLELTREGCEMQFATNHLGHFALSLGLYHAMAAAGSARIVSVSSNAHLCSPVVFDDIDFTFRPYDPALAYGQSKTANVLFAVGVTARWSASGITANAVMPGVIATDLMRHMPSDWMETAGQRAGGTLSLKSTQQGAATSVLLAASPMLEGISGRYFENCNEADCVACDRWAGQWRRTVCARTPKRRSALGAIAPTAAMTPKRLVLVDAVARVRREDRTVKEAGTAGGEIDDEFGKFAGRDRACKGAVGTGFGAPDAVGAKVGIGIVRISEEVLRSRTDGNRVDSVGCVHGGDASSQADQGML